MSVKDDDPLRAGLERLLPDLRRYCARMLGSWFDGDDAAQDALAQALAKQHLLLDGAPLAPWVFRIAHNRCVDLLRRRGRLETEEMDEYPMEDPPRQQPGRAAFARLARLPVRQRAMFLLVELFELSLAEAAATLACSEDAVKSGLRRARRTLEALAGSAADLEPDPPPPDTLALVEAYARRFDAGDWDGLFELIHREAQLDVAGIYCGLGRDKVFNRYFHNYRAFDFPWRVVPALLPSGLCVLSWKVQRRPPELLGAMRLEIDGSRVVRITDYLHDELMILALAEEIAATGTPERYWPRSPSPPVRSRPPRIDPG